VSYIAESKMLSKVRRCEAQNTHMKVSEEGKNKRHNLLETEETVPMAQSLLQHRTSCNRNVAELQARSPVLWID